ncbi:hypothetical protein TUN199_00722 [Pyrenophora tritici-repentis]|nr:hypothetical protein Alg215_00706 [Pyrenophora tritici-repentis]KAI0627319.1 hypothetical protein TUN199_00722 [Pyrenophora tritici-repentis]
MSTYILLTTSLLPIIHAFTSTLTPLNLAHISCGGGSQSWQWICRIKGMLGGSWAWKSCKACGLWDRVEEE